MLRINKGGGLHDSPLRGGGMRAMRSVETGHDGKDHAFHWQTEGQPLQGGGRLTPKGCFSFPAIRLHAPCYALK